jgi:cytochrome b6-f complex iron-sulfur subunit
LRRAGGGGGGQAAKDANGDVVKSKKWLATHMPGDRQLSQGLKARTRGVA